MSKSCKPEKAEPEKLVKSHVPMAPEKPQTSNDEEPDADIGYNASEEESDDEEEEEEGMGWHCPTCNCYFPYLPPTYHAQHCGCAWFGAHTA